MDANMTGLSAQEVQERRERGEGGTGAKSITKSRAQIIRENVITLFNLLNFIIAGLLFAVGAYTNMPVSGGNFFKYCGRNCTGAKGEKAGG